jgi:hypothetical protein
MSKPNRKKIVIEVHDRGKPGIARRKTLSCPPILSPRYPDKNKINTWMFN